MAVICFRQLVRYVMTGLFVCLFIGVDAEARAAASPVVLDYSAAHELYGHFEYVADPSGKESLADILALPAKRFVTLEAKLNKGFRREPVWLRFTLVRKPGYPEISWIRLSSYDLSNVRVYLQTGNDPAISLSYKELCMMGDGSVSASSHYEPNIVVPISLPLDKPVTVFVRAQSGSSLSLTGAVHTADDLALYTHRAIIFNAAFLGIALVILVIHLIAFMRIGDRLYLWFAFYVSGVFLHYFMLTGMYALIVPGMMPIVSDYLARVGMGFALMMFSLFGGRLFTSVRNFWAHIYLKLVAVMGAMTILSIPFGFYNEVSASANIGAIGSVLILTWFSVLAVKNREQEGKLYVLAFGVFNPLYLLHFLQILGVVSIGWLSIGAFRLASLLSMVIMTLALTERLRFAERKSRDAARQAEQEALRLAGEITKELQERKSQLEIALASEQLAMERQRSFLRMMSHEYRTPLAIILGNLDIIEMNDTATSFAHREEVNKIRRAVGRLVEIMDVSLKQSRLAVPQEEFRFDCFSAAQFLEGMLAEAHALYPKRIYRYTGCSELQEIYGDPRYLHTLMLNLLDNAFKYSPSDSVVEVDCRIEESEVVIRIVNQSRHLDTGEIDGLFEKFRRGSNSADTSGAGLGLWLARQIVARHNGRLKLRSSEIMVVATVYLPEKRS
jgi:signal transduction histidine kinase